jgi:excisionase family DNA binding protein
MSDQTRPARLAIGIVRPLPPHRRETPGVAGSCGRQAADFASLATVAEAAKELRVSVRSLRRWIASGQVQIVRFGRAVRIPHSEVQRLAKAGITC